MSTMTRPDGVLACYEQKEINMPITKTLSAKDVETKEPKQFIATENFGTMSGNDLYWLLYQAASETGSSGSAETFCNNVEALLTERLGAGRYGLHLAISPNSSGGSYDLVPILLPTNLFWGGDAGVLPGFGAKNAVQCLVWWS